MKKFNLFFLLIIALGLSLTLFKIGNTPNGFHWDEAANGYNSFSLLKSGKDEWGVKWPIFIKSFGDYKSAFMAYALIPFFIVGGVNPTMARIPVAILAILGVFGLMKFIKNHGYDKLAILSGLVLTTNPWFLHYARIAFEPMPSLGVMLLGLWLWVNKNKKVKTVGAILLLLSMYIYHSPRLFLPIIIVVYQIIFYKKEALLKIRQNLLSWMIFILGTIFILYGVMFGKSGTRAKQVFFWNNTEITSQVEEGIYRNRILNYPLVRVFNNKGLVILTKLSKQYASHFSPEYLLPENNQSPAFSFPKHGNFYLLLVPFLIFGIFSAKKRDKLFWFFLSWLLLAPIPSSLTQGHTNPNRSLIMLPALSFFTARGILITLELISLKIKSKFIILISQITMIIIFIFNFSWYIHDWLIYFPELSEHYWHDFYKNASQDIWNNRHNYEKIYFTNTDTQPYIFFAWYNQIEPSLIQQQTHNRDDELVEGIKQIDNIYFWDVKPHTTPCYLLQPQSLVVASHNDPDVLPNDIFPPHFVYTRENRFHHGDIALRAWESEKLTDKQKKILLNLCPQPSEIIPNNMKKNK